jgi:hypothetical protein
MTELGFQINDRIRVWDFILFFGEEMLVFSVLTLFFFSLPNCVLTKFPHYVHQVPISSTSCSQ